MRDICHTRVGVDEAAKKSLRVSLWDGIFASAMGGFTSDYFTPFVLSLGGTARHVGALNALQHIAVAFGQLKSPDWTASRGSRRLIINTSVFIQAFVIMGMALLAYSRAPLLVLFFLLAFLFSGTGAVATPAWSSLMSDLIKKEKMGAYFGWRNRVQGPVMVVCSLSAGFFLNAIHGVSRCLAFGTIFLAAAVFRLLSWFFLTRMHEPPIAHSKEHQFTLWMFLRRFRESNFAKFVFFVAAMNFSVNLASPFFPVLMLRDLHFSYALYAFVTVTATLTMFIAMDRWGRLADRCGNLLVLKSTAPLIAVVPLLWVLDRHPFFLVFAQIFSGFAWGGFNICAGNYIIDAVTPEKRTRCFAYYSFFNGLALALGGFLGGLWGSKLPPLFGYNLLSLLVLSSILRLLVAFFMPLHLKEVRPVACMSRTEFFLSALGFKPV